MDNVRSADFAADCEPHTCDPSAGVVSELLEGRATLGAFLIEPATRTLLHDGSPVELGGRAFDLLVTLLSARGQIISKDMLMRRVWQNATVEEANLRVQLSKLRHALGEESWRIKTVPNRGYLLVSDPPVARSGPACEAPRPIELAVVFIDAGRENREMLQRMLLSAGVHVENLPSLAGLLDTRTLDGEARLPVAYRGAA